LIKFIQRY